MAYKVEKNGEIVIAGFENGIASSPHKGFGNMKAVNISTETGEVMCNFARTKQSQDLVTGSFTVSGSTTLLMTLTSGTLLPGSWIVVSNSTIAALTNGTNYYVLDVVGTTVKLSTAFAFDVASAISYVSGSCDFQYSANSIISTPVASATEFYTDSSNTAQYRYYIADQNGHVFINDSSSASVSGVTQPKWFLADLNTHSSTQGIAILNGWLFLFATSHILCKPTVNLGAAFSTFSGGTTTSLAGSPNPHFAFVGHQGSLYYTDGNFIGKIFPNTSLMSGLGVNIQSYCSYTAVTTTGTISTILSGSLPTPSTVTSTTRVPAFLFAGTGGTKPSAITTGTIYYVDYTLGLATPGNFKVYAALTGGSALDISDGVGTQYFNTFYPASGDGNDVMTFTPQRLNLPTFETAQTIGEIGNTILIGCKSNTMYPWDQVSPTPSTIINLPENNVTSILTVNNTGLIFAGNKGNIYITNGATASPVLKVPDYCAGTPGTPATYIEPYYTWGGNMYLRGRVYFSLSSSNSNCGGIWSFQPTQNFYIEQDTGIGLRLENQSSYGTYNGKSPVLLPSQNQAGVAPQYWNGWDSGVTTYGIDFTSTIPGTTAVIETDLIPTGTVLDKKTFSQIEYKLAAPLASGESVAISYRLNGTDAYTSLGTVNTESATSLAGYWPVNFDKSQWLQLQITLTPLASSSSSFVRLQQVMIR
jgi:hypothetical protein